jgi:hypothetical protein
MTMLRVFVLLGVLGAASAHGYLAQPASRNLLNSNWCPQCFNGPGVCGDPRGSRAHERPGRVTARYRAGGVIDARIVVTAEHLGRWSLGLCAPAPGRPCSSPRDFRLLPRADGRGPYVYRLEPRHDRAAFRLPPGTCAKCVLRWWWETGNSCTPRGTPRAFANTALPTCRKPIETFTNCADVALY